MKGSHEMGRGAGKKSESKASRFSRFLRPDRSSASSKPEVRADANLPINPGDSNRDFEPHEDFDPYKDFPGANPSGTSRVEPTLTPQRASSNTHDSIAEAALSTMTARLNLGNRGEQTIAGTVNRSDQLKTLEPVKREMESAYDRSQPKDYSINQNMKNDFPDLANLYDAACTSRSGPDKVRLIKQLMSDQKEFKSGLSNLSQESLEHSKEIKDNFARINSWVKDNCDATERSKGKFNTNELYQIRQHLGALEQTPGQSTRRVDTASSVNDTLPLGDRGSTSSSAPPPPMQYASRSGAASSLDNTPSLADRGDASGSAPYIPRVSRVGEISPGRASAGNASYFSPSRRVDRSPERIGTDTSGQSASTPRDIPRTIAPGDSSHYQAPMDHHIQDDARFAQMSIQDLATYYNSIHASTTNEGIRQNAREAVSKAITDRFSQGYYADNIWRHANTCNELHASCQEISTKNDADFIKDAAQIHRELSKNNPQLDSDVKALRDLRSTPVGREIYQSLPFTSRLAMDAIKADSPSVDDLNIQLGEAVALRMRSWRPKLKEVNEVFLEKRIFGSSGTANSLDSNKYHYTQLQQAQASFEPFRQMPITQMSSSLHSISSAYLTSANKKFATDRNAIDLQGVQSNYRFMRSLVDNYHADITTIDNNRANASDALLDATGKDFDKYIAYNVKPTLQSAEAKFLSFKTDVAYLSHLRDQYNPQIRASYDQKLSELRGSRDTLQSEKTSVDGQLLLLRGLPGREFFLQKEEFQIKYVEQISSLESLSASMQQSLDGISSFLKGF